MRLVVMLFLGAIFGSAAPVRAATVGFVDVPRLVAGHPLHRILVQYDRAIAALSSTQGVVGLRDPQLSAEHAAMSLQAAAASAAARARALGSRGSAENITRERRSIAALLQSRQLADRQQDALKTQLVAETNANVRGYSGAMAQRVTRAYAARDQQLREKESGLAYALERDNAGKRLMLRVRLDDLHLSAARRANLQAQLRALNASELRTVTALRRSDAAELARYCTQLEQTASAGANAMDAQLRAKSDANYVVLQRVFNEEPDAAGLFPSSSQLAAFTAGYAASRSAQDISSGLQSAASDVRQRFQRIAGEDARSRQDLASQLASLRAERAALYRSIREQIAAAAKLVARQRHLSAISFSGDRSKFDTVDLTRAVESRLAQGW